MEKSRILIVDDEKAIRTSLSDYLGGSGYDVAAVEDGYQAIEKVKDEEWDLALVDLKMPDLDGLAVLREIIKIKPHLLVMIITGQIGRERRNDEEVPLFSLIFIRQSTHSIARYIQGKVS